MNAPKNKRRITRRGLLAGGGLALVAASFALLGRSRANPYYSGPATDHFDGRIFFNPGGQAPRSFGDLVRWKLGETAARWPDNFESPFTAGPAEQRVQGARVKVTMIGHATLLIQTRGVNIVTDPIWSNRASPFQFAGPARVNAPAIALDEMPPVDVVLVTHNHYDHLDIATLVEFVRRWNPLIVTPLGNDSLIGQSLSGARFAAGDWWDTEQINSELTIHFVPVHHWSARGLGDRRMALWCGFVIETPDGNLLHIGDTGFAGGSPFEALARRFGGFRLANLPIGAYAPRWFMKAQHMNPDEAVRGMLLAGARMAIGHHWGTFQLTNEPIEEPAQGLAAACVRHGVEEKQFTAARPGQIFEV